MFLKHKKQMAIYNLIEKEIIDSLSNFIPNVEDWDNNTYWTKSIKKILRDIGKNYKYLVYTSGIKDVNYGEYLYDLVWSEYTNSLKNIPLVTEIEWKTDFETELQHDFEKLLLAKAELRLFIFQANNDQIANHCFNEFDKIVNDFKHNQVGDRYLYLCFVHDSVKFVDYQKIV